MLAHTMACDPSEVPETYFRQAARTARFGYRGALAEWPRQYEAWKTDPTGSKPSDPAWRKQRHAIQGDPFSWMREVTQNAPRMAGDDALGARVQELLGGDRLHEPLRFIGIGEGGPVSRIADRRSLRVTGEIPDPPYPSRKPNGGRFGRFGLATRSTGETIGGPKGYAAALAQLRRLSTPFSRQREAANVCAVRPPDEPMAK